MPIITRVDWCGSARMSNFFRGNSSLACACKDWRHAQFRSGLQRARIAKFVIVSAEFSIWLFDIGSFVGY